MSGDRLERLRAARQRQQSGVSAPKVTSSSDATVDGWVPSRASGGGSKGGGAPSLLEQATSTFMAVPRGLVGLGSQAWDSTAGNVGGAFQNVVLQRSADEIRRGGWLGRAFANESMLDSVHSGKGFRDNLESALPLFNEFGASATDTIGRVTDQAAALAPGGKAAGEGAYAKASREGRILPLLLEDVGNAVLAGGVASQAVAGGGRAAAASAAGASPRQAARAGLTANAGLPVKGRTAQRAERIATGARKIDEATGKVLLAPYTRPFSAAKKGIGKVAGPVVRKKLDGTPLGRALARGGAIGQGAEGVEYREKMAQLAAEEGDFMARLVDTSRASVANLSPAEQIAGRLQASGLADALAPLADLADNERRLVLRSAVVDENGPFAAMIERVEDPEVVVDGFDLALRARDDAGLAVKLAEERELWEPITAERDRLYQEQFGILDTRDPEFIAMLAGDERLPFETNRVAAKHIPLLERTLRELEANQKRQDRASGRVRFDDGEGGRTMAGRNREIVELSRKLVDTEGADSLARLLGMDEGATPAQVRERVRNEISGRAYTEASGKDLPQDVITDFMRSADIKPAPQLSTRGLAGAVKEVGKEAVAEVAGKDADRALVRRVRAEQRVDQMADRLADKLSERNVRLGGPIAKLKAAVKTEMAADRNVRAAASAAAKLEADLRAGVLSDKEIRRLVTDVRRGALPLLDAALREAAGRLDRWWEGPINYKSMPAGERQIFIDAISQATGMKPKEWAQMRLPSGQRMFSDNGVQPDRIADTYTDAMGGERLTGEEFLEAVAGDLAEYIVVKDSHTWITKGKIKRRTVKEPDPYRPGKERAVRAESGRPKLTYQRIGGGKREFLDPDSLAGVPELVEAMMPEPDLAAAVFSDDPVGAVRDLKAAWFEEEFADVRVEADAAVAEAYRAFDDQAEQSGMAPDGSPDLTGVRDEFVSTARNHREGRAMGAAFDKAVARMEQSGTRLNTQVPLNRVARQMHDKGARKGAAAGRALGDAEGRARALGVQERQARRRAAGRPDDVQGELLRGAADVHGRGFRQGQAEGRRIRDVELLQREEAKLYRKLGRQQEAMTAAMSDAVDRIVSAPAKYRPALTASRGVAEAIDRIVADADLPADAETALRQAQAELVVSVTDALDTLTPDHVAAGRLGGSGAASGKAAAARKAQAEYRREGVVPSMTATDQAVLIARDMHQRVRNEAAKWIIDRHGGKPADLVPEQFLVDENGAPLKGDALIAVVDAYSDRPMTPWNPRTPFDPVRNANMDTVFVPQWARDAFDGQYAPAGNVELILRSWVDKPTRWWKNDVLALSPRWHQGNIVGNMLMAWAGGIPPHRQLSLAREAWRMTKDQSGPNRLRDAGVGAEQSMFFRWADELGQEGGRGPTKEALRLFEQQNNRVQERVLSKFDPESKPGRVANAVGHPISNSYRMNGFVDDFTHNIVFLDRMKKGVGEEQAIKDSLRIAGDFSNMTRFERSVIRRVMPFYSWMRHITGLTANLAVSHPLRSAWTLHLWTLFADEEGDYSDIPGLGGTIPLGNNEFIRGASYMPFGTVLDLDPSDPFGTIAGSANPFGKLAIESGTGIEFGPAGIAPMSRTPGTGRVDAYGNELFGPIGIKPTLHRAAKMFPTMRMYQQLRTSGDDRIVRYDDGGRVSLQGRFGRRTIADDNAQDNAEIIFRNRLGLPIAMEQDAAATRQRIAEKERERKKRYG